MTLDPGTPLGLGAGYITNGSGPLNTYWFEGRFLLGASFWADYDVTRDGSRFLMLEAADASDSQLNVVVNWMDALNESAPTSLPQ
jgi:hypothetical protein